MIDVRTAIADDLDMADGLETVTLWARGGEYQLSSSALRRMVTTREAEASGGAYTAADVRFHVKRTASVSPLLGDVLIDEDGEEWIVLAVETGTLRTRWGLVARRVSIAGAVTATVAVERQGTETDDAGVPYPVWRPTGASLVVRFQAEPAPEIGPDTRPDGVRRQRRRWRVYLPRAVTFAGGDTLRVTAGDMVGRRFAVLAEEGFGRIDQLPSVVVEEVRLSVDVGDEA